MLRSVQLFAVACLGTVASYALPVLVTSPGALGPNDSVNWAQLGAPGTTLGPFAATSTGGVAISGHFSGPSPTGLTACEAPPNTCNWSGGFTPGDSLVWADNGSSIPGSGPLSLSFGALLGAGAMIQSDAAEPFTAQIQAFDGAVLLGSFTVASDANSDPLFIGVLDTTAEVTSVSFDVINTSIPHDFAIDTLDLRTASNSTVPEPSALISSLLLVGLLLVARTLLARFRNSSREAKRVALSLTICAIAVSITLPAFGQSDGTILVNPGDLQVMNEGVARAALTAAGASGLGADASLTSQLAFWTGSVTGYDGNIYTYSMVGQSPFNRGARTTTIQTVVIPLKITIAGFIFDPLATDNGCLGAAGNTAYGLTLGSPIFQNAPYTMNGVNVGTTQYIDAFQRANFWSRVQLTGNSYHTILNPIVVAEQSLTYASGNSSTSAVFGVGGTQCGSSPGPVNQFARIGVVNINVIDPQLQGIIAALGLTPSQFPLFVTYKSVISNGAANNLNNCCILGYHNSTTFVVTNPGQTYGISEFDTGTVFTGVHDTDVLAHEVGEWMDDPSGNNPTPAWGNIGQVGGCQGNLEVGDPLSGTEFVPNVTLNGFTYHLQELAFFSWFYAGTGPSIAAGGKFSDNGTFSGGAKACPPGGTN
jgi:hypothetical protein